jgi:hypothetical protein
MSALRRIVDANACRLAVIAGVVWLAAGCELLFDDDPCAGAEPPALGFTTFTSTSFCDGDDVMVTHQCIVEGEPTSRSFATFERDCSASGAQCVSGTCVSRTETCPEGHRSFCDAAGVRSCVDEFVAVRAATCDDGQRCIEVDEGGTTRAQCALSDVPCSSERGMCDGNVDVWCAGGFPILREPCSGFTSRCIDTDIGASCIAPECAPGVTADICVDDTVVACSEYGSYARVDCGSEGKECVAQDDHAFCVSTAQVTELAWTNVPGGSFTFLSNGGEPNPVTLPGFEIMTTEVTWAQYQACIDVGACSLAGDCSGHDANRPLYCAESWMALSFCTWKGGRLPAETEWQYVATNLGTTTFPWGNERPSCNLAALGAAGAATQSCSDAPVEACSVASDRTELGVCDMAGNVRELVVRPGFPESPYSAGGSFATPAAEVSLLPNEPRIFDEYPFLDVGFRCVR